MHFIGINASGTGKIEVYHFFCLYFVMLPYTDKRKFNISDVGGFFIKRICRIYPMFLITILFYKLFILYNFFLARFLLFNIPANGYLQNKYIFLGLAWTFIIYFISKGKLLIAFLEKSKFF